MSHNLTESADIRTFNRAGKKFLKICQRNTIIDTEINTK